ncbi:SDR family NAD(P)-dependent oxidoreductase [Solimonas soli]|jgi:NAD(P)-dependent dehydrogenase (short-subunit alcohol dehydrogenase family)|uniref:SDR family NAD(P)-dependent oxidoreductase n=1 Tax=Solimonas soli TaxID=413479 RepID=UPI00048713B2|nr:SDR family NAD(P)-dependent oxidoreductase [Solimonas soli]
MDLKGSNVVVTGAFGSLGAAVMRGALAAGANVAGIDRIAAASAADAFGAARLYGDVDLGDARAASAALDRIAADLGGIDALVNVAGAFRWETLQGGKLETWDLLYNVNVRTAAAASQAALPHLLRRAPGGRIVNIGAAGAIKAAAGMGAYAASKAGVAKLTEALAEELKDHGITVNAVLPSIIDTAPNRADMRDADFSRWVTVDQLTDVILFLLSPRSQAVTGALIPVVGRV